MTPPGPRERKKLRTAAKIEGVARRLFLQRGHDATTVDEIATEVDIAPRTFFRYFPTKEDVVLGPDGKRMTLLGSALAKRPPAGPPMTALRDAFHEVGRDFEAHRDALLRRTQLIATISSLRARNFELQIGTALPERFDRCLDLVETGLGD